MESIYIGVEKELDLLDYDSLLYSFFKGEHIYVGHFDSFGSQAKIICLIHPNENNLFKDSLQIEGVAPEKSNQLAVQIAQAIAQQHQTKTLCAVPTAYAASHPESFLLCNQDKSFLVEEVAAEENGLPAGGLKIIKAIQLAQ